MKHVFYQNFPLTAKSDIASLIRTKEMRFGRAMAARGRWKISVFNECGKEVRSTGWKNNLLTNLGLDNVATMPWADIMNNSVIGTGVLEVTRDSAAVTGTISSGTFTASGSFFQAGDAGAVIKFDGIDTHYTITGDISGTQVTVTGADQATPTEFTIYHVDKNGLTTEHKRTATVVAGVSNNFANLTADGIIMRITHQHAAEVGTVTILEAGVSDQAGAGSNLNAIFEVDPGVVANATESYRVYYELTISMSPVVSTPGVIPVPQWPIAPSTSVDGDFNVSQTQLAGKDENGLTVEVTHPSSVGGYANEPSSIDITNNEPDSVLFFMSNSTLALAAFNAVSMPDRSGGGSSFVTKTGVLLSYNSGDYFIDKKVEFLEAEANRTDWRSFGFGNPAGGFPGVALGDGAAFTFLADEDQTKSALDRLSLTYRISWGRVLTNDGD